MKQLIIIILLNTFLIKTFCEFEPIHEDWVKMDSVFLNQIKKAYRSNFLSIETFLNPNKKEISNLGYGYSLITGSMGKGYVSIFYTLVYKNDILISYKLDPQMPNDIRIYQRYIQFYDGMFIMKNNKPEVLIFNFYVMTKPLNDYKYPNKLQFKIQYFMTPYSDVIYGDYGGEANTILRNREAFNSIKGSINEEILLLLLHSINPASRFCAAEFYFQNKSLFRQHEIIEKLIEQNFKKLPEIYTMNGCILFVDKSREILKRMINKNK